MKDYSEFSDDELIARLRDGEKDITEYLVNKYKDLVRMKARSMFILGGDSEDLIQEGMIGLFKALRDYDFGRDASFATFADLCVSRQMYTAVQASTRQKHSPLNTYISLYAKVSPDGDIKASDDTYLLEALDLEESISPEDMVIDKENIDALEKKIDSVLSPFEKEVLELHLTGLTYLEIAKILGKDDKSTDNALQRIKTKIRKIIKEK